MSKNSKIGYSKKVNPTLDVPVDFGMSRVATAQQISSYMKNYSKAIQTEYHETDTLVVTKVTRNQPGVRLSVDGDLINGKSKISGVVPINPNTIHVPLIGEHLTVVEREGVPHFTDVVNRKGSLNENSIPGVVGGYDSNTQYGKNFKRTKVTPIEIGEGCIVREGRFGQSIHFDGHNNVPTIKISNSIYTGDKEYRPERIDDDDSSIYFTSKGLPGNNPFDGEKVEGKKVLIQSDGIFIKGREEVRIKAIEELKINSPNLVVNGNETKLGSEDAKQPIIRGDDLVQFLESMLSQLSTAANAFTTDKPGGTALQTAMTALKTQLNLSTMKSKKVKTV
tara:strand:- start:86 stop:1093 length:1008 start_codon:yes stop_codon:yes gene_type:complete